jgi:outer membrane receptor for Fe3+-dicitrate
MNGINIEIIKATITPFVRYNKIDSEKISAASMTFHNLRLQREHVWNE